jgi:hypothetical protein
MLIYIRCMGIKERHGNCDYARRVALNIQNLLNKWFGLGILVGLHFNRETDKIEVFVGLLRRGTGRGPRIQSKIGILS